MTFQLDTSGIVLGETRPNGKGGVQPDGAWTWGALNAFTVGYIAAMFESIPTIGRTYEGFAARGHRPIAFRDLTPETLARIIEDCAWLCTDAPSRAASAEVGREAWAVRQAGQMAHADPLTVLLGDDGKVRFA